MSVDTAVDKQETSAAQAADAAGAAGAAATQATNQVAADLAQTTEEWKPKILAFTCNWCTYAGADLAGLNRMNYPADVRLLRLPCSGRVNPQFVLHAFQKGCDGVLVCGCHPGDCHYATGNYFTRRRMLLYRRFLEFFGIEPERFIVKWISGAEAGKFRDTVVEACEGVAALGPNTKYREEGR